MVSHTGWSRDGTIVFSSGTASRRSLVLDASAQACWWTMERMGNSCHGHSADCLVIRMSACPANYRINPTVRPVPWLAKNPGALPGWPAGYAER